MSLKKVILWVGWVLAGVCLIVCITCILCKIRQQKKKKVTDKVKKPNKTKYVYIQTQSPFEKEDYINIAQFLEKKNIKYKRLENLDGAAIKTQPILCTRYTTGRTENDTTAFELSEDDIQRTIVLLLSKGLDETEDHGHEIDPASVHYGENPNSAFKNLYGIVLVNVNCIVGIDNRIVEPCEKCVETLGKLSTKISSINEKMILVSE